MPIYSRGKSSAGFASLDSLVAVIIAALLWSVCYPAYHAIIQSLTTQEERITDVQQNLNNREVQSWEYAPES